MAPWLSILSCHLIPCVSTVLGSTMRTPCQHYMSGHDREIAYRTTTWFGWWVMVNMTCSHVLYIYAAYGVFAFASYECCAKCVCATVGLALDVFGY
ncbi:hypothetical protein K491DRAFT_687519 [Lophiostoma macrostomum CBS 122681]|uniref:Uncharacterized protein n=1 Tax=Lophiostoma macrostomum CBS 122681 TaxID=1314788 RepID=A0A6A6TQX8_9PLEO|nr:hypothetical protein K491DRAFT_687519 [Lophiostoma macrostomum CBS 122681]